MKTNISGYVCCRYKRNDLPADIQCRGELLSITKKALIAGIYRRYIISWYSSNAEVQIVL